MNNQIKVTYLDHMGSDLQVVNAARASFGKESKGPITEADVSLLNFLARGFTQKEWYELAIEVWWAESIEEVQELLWKIKTTPTHFAPFTHPQLSIRVEAPLSIARQLWRSHVGLSGGDCGYPGWSEESRRYVDDDPICFLPDSLRGRPAHAKQGSSDESFDQNQALLRYLEETYEISSSRYKALISAGTAPELARFGLSQGMMVSWVWTGSLSAWTRVLSLRSNGHAQKEAQYFASELADIVEGLFPYSFAALTTGTAVYKEPLCHLENIVDKFTDFFKKLFLLP
jgi:thymidylate synthase (FAD)